MINTAINADSTDLTPNRPFPTTSPTDVLVRYGGEEFLVILPGAGRGDLTDMAERIRRSISETEIVTGGHRLSITVSIGGAGLPDQVIRDPAGLIGIADQALYSAKAAGRDRSVIA